MRSGYDPGGSPREPGLGWWRIRSSLVSPCSASIALVSRLVAWLFEDGLTIKGADVVMFTCAPVFSLIVKTWSPIGSSILSLHSVIAGPRASRYYWVFVVNDSWNWVSGICVVSNLIVKVI
jgi:hypothetical protein